MADKKVIIKGMTFDPPDLKIKKGDRVYWVNEEDSPNMEHTATNQDPGKGQVFDTGFLKGGKKEPFTSGLYIFNKTTSYLCLKHASTMFGKITVEP